MGREGDLPSAVQARSLVELIQLANDPPQVSRERGRDGESRLTLYIARVPGSRDVFLTPTKPVGKMVRSEDVQGCLYYIHVQSEEDDCLIDEESDDLHDKHSASAPRPVVRRKPVASRTPSAHGDEATIQAGSVLASQSNLPVGNNVRASRTDVVNLHDFQCYGGNQPTVEGSTAGARKLLGPRPMRGSHHAVNSTPFSSVPGPTASKLSKLSAQQGLPCEYDRLQALENAPEPLPAPQPGGFETLAGNSSGLQDANAHSRWSGPRSGTKISKFGGWLTVIRRHDGAQANIGQITSADAQSLESHLDIFTPGYAKFSPVEKRHSDIISQSSAPGTDFYRTAIAQREPLVDQEPASSGKESGLEQLNPRNDTGISDPRSRRSWGAALGRFARASHPAYTFLSPWRETCVFSPTLTGRSLKCHKLSGTSRKLDEGSCLSELRFNLPGSEAPHSSPGKHLSQSPTQSAAWSFSASQSHPRSSLSTAPGGDKEADEERLDLSLGQENAGGGFGGKQAKMGKLIIEADGSQMLDLLIMANISMWWKVYGKLGGA